MKCIDPVLFALPDAVLQAGATLRRRVGWQAAAQALLPLQLSHYLAQGWLQWRAARFGAHPDLQQWRNLQAFTPGVMRCAGQAWHVSTMFSHALRERQPTFLPSALQQLEAAFPDLLAPCFSAGAWPDQVLEPLLLRRLLNALMACDLSQTDTLHAWRAWVRATQAPARQTVLPAGLADLLAALCQQDAVCHLRRCAVDLFGVLHAAGVQQSLFSAQASERAHWRALGLMHNFCEESWHASSAGCQKQHWFLLDVRQAPAQTCQRMIEAQLETLQAEAFLLVLATEDVSHHGQFAQLYAALLERAALGMVCHFHAGQQPGSVLLVLRHACPRLLLARSGAELSKVEMHALGHTLRHICAGWTLCYPLETPAQRAQALAALLSDGSLLLAA
ncbi:hypothetical protein V8J88_12070 [Massilia sp. W12]|uniref:hypothetical protein n=1 Tax=Massilia sp. W12 TaxID=3126507 RepID=UPI0030D03E6D